MKVIVALIGMVIALASGYQLRAWTEHDLTNARVDALQAATMTEDRVMSDRINLLEKQLVILQTKLDNVLNVVTKIEERTR